MLKLLFVIPPFSVSQPLLSPLPLPQSVSRALLYTAIQQPLLSPSPPPSECKQGSTVYGYPTAPAESHFSTVESNCSNSHGVLVLKGNIYSINLLGLNKGLIKHLCLNVCALPICATFECQVCEKKTVLCISRTCHSQPYSFQCKILSFHVGRKKMNIL